MEINMANENNMELREKVENVLNKIRPSLRADGGDVKLVNVDKDGAVSVKLQGACGACPLSQVTLKMSIEQQLKKEIPEIKSVKAV
jgi:Fe-S cluster biogenesis protein NfuA